MVVYRALRFHFSFPPLALPFDLFRRTFFSFVVVGRSQLKRGLQELTLGQPDDPLVIHQ